MITTKYVQEFREYLEEHIKANEGRFYSPIIVQHRREGEVTATKHMLEMLNCYERQSTSARDFIEEVYKELKEIRNVDTDHDKEIATLEDEIARAARLFESTQKNYTQLYIKYASKCEEYKQLENKLYDECRLVDKLQREIEDFKQRLKNLLSGPSECCIEK